MEVPSKIKIPLCIERGSVFNFFIDFNNPRRQAKNRYFIVLNRNPKTDLTLILVTPTTRVQKKKEFVRRVGISEKTIVEVKAGEYSVFISDSVFNCNDFLEVGLDVLIKKIEENGSMNYPKLPEGILGRIVAGIHESPKVPQSIKDLT